jgi:hypothetical protein
MICGKIILGGGIDLGEELRSVNEVVQVNKAAPALPFNRINLVVANVKKNCRVLDDGSTKDGYGCVVQVSRFTESGWHWF